MRGSIRGVAPVITDPTQFHQDHSRSHRTSYRGVAPVLMDPSESSSIEGRGSRRSSQSGASCTIDPAHVISEVAENARPRRSNLSSVAGSVPGSMPSLSTDMLNQQFKVPSRCSVSDFSPQSQRASGDFSPSSLSWSRKSSMAHFDCNSRHSSKSSGNFSNAP